MFCSVLFDGYLHIILRLYCLHWNYRISGTPRAHSSHPLCQQLSFRLWCCSSQRDVAAASSRLTSHAMPNPLGRAGRSRPCRACMAVAATDQGLIYAQCLKIVASSSVFRRLFHAAQDCHSTKFCPGSIKLSYLGFFGSWRQCGLWLRRVRQRRRSPQHCILSWAVESKFFALSFSRTRRFVK